MHEQAMQQEMRKLADLIRYHNENYFQRGISEISDYTYDRLLERLTQLERTYPHWKEPHSPTEALGERPSHAFPTAFHRTPMLSLSKTYSEAEMVRFANDVQRKFPDCPVCFVCEPKIDGMALSLVYQEGRLVQIVTRGDGEKGDDITQNARELLPIPREIRPAPHPFFEVRGEACLSKSLFQTLNQARAEAGEPLFANPRNLAAGTLKTTNLDAVKGRRLDFYAYNLYVPNQACTTHEAALRLLASWGFSVAPDYQLCRTVAEVVACIRFWAVHRHTLPVELDGVVLKVNDLDQQERLGNTAKSPRWAMAYKYTPERNSSILEAVCYQVGRTGVVTPVACFQPILLAGTSVKRASLHNAAALMRKDLHLGDALFIEKGGDIIPQVVGVEPAPPTSRGPAVAFPESCPACHTPLRQAVGEAAHYCPNARQCPPQLKGTLLHFAHRKAMDVEGLGPKTIDLLFEAGCVRTPADLYALTYERVCALPGFQAASSQKLLAAIEASKTKPFDKVLFALGIKHVGAAIAKKLAHHFPTLSQLAQASEMDLCTLPEVGAKMAQSVRRYFEDPYHQAILTGLQKAGLRFAHPNQHAHPDTNPQPALPLAEKKIVLSGTFLRCSRAELSQRIEQAGGRPTAVLSAQTDWLVVGQKPGPAKLAKAEKWGIPIVGENEIMQIIQL